MSDEEKQLTVAELLERAQANRGSAQRASGRRRRRSLEDGGISVAELTGSLSRVKEKPAESKHSSVPIDTPESERRSRPRTPSSPAATAPSVAGINATPLSGASFKPASASPAAWGAPQQRA
ncbi:CPBP family intramembrane glutamate endopeptidase, partial [Corynebacterium mastitidis]